MAKVGLCFFKKDDKLDWGREGGRRRDSFAFWVGVVFLKLQAAARDGSRKRGLYCHLGKKNCFERCDLKAFNGWKGSSFLEVKILCFMDGRWYLYQVMVSTNAYFLNYLKKKNYLKLGFFNTLKILKKFILFCCFLKNHNISSILQFFLKEDPLQPATNLPKVSQNHRFLRSSWANGGKQFTL